MRSREKDLSPEEKDVLGEKTTRPRRDRRGGRPTARSTRGSSGALEGNDPQAGEKKRGAGGLTVSSDPPLLTLEIFFTSYVSLVTSAIQVRGQPGPRGFKRAHGYVLERTLKVKWTCPKAANVLHHVLPPCDRLPKTPTLWGESTFFPGSFLSSPPAGRKSS